MNTNQSPAGGDVEAREAIWVLEDLRCHSWSSTPQYLHKDAGFFASEPYAWYGEIGGGGELQTPDIHSARRFSSHAEALEFRQKYGANVRLSTWDIQEHLILPLTSTKAEPSRIAEVHALLLDEAKRHSDFTKSMQARRKAEYIERGETAPDYRGMEPEETIYWEAATIITAIEADLNDYKHWADDVRHLTRLLDIELNGDNAAKQASLCDLIGSIKPLKDDKDRLTKALARARTYVEMSYDENGGEEAAEAKHDLKEIDLALSPPSTSQSEGEG